MSVTFIPSNQEFVQCVDTEWPTIGSFDMDTANVLMRGPRTKLVAYLNSLTRYTKLTGFPFMWLNGWEEASITPNFPGVMLHYVGFRDGAPAPVFLENDTVISTATGTGEDTEPISPTFGMQITGTVQYLASRSTWSFYMIVTPPNAPPTTPPVPYNLVNSGVAPQPFAYSISQQIGVDGTPVPVSVGAFTAVINSLVETTLVASWTRVNIIPGYLWACKSVVQVQLEST